MGILLPTISHQVYWTDNQRCQTESLPNSIILFSAIKRQKIWVVGFISTRAVVYNKQKDGGDLIVEAVAWKFLNLAPWNFCRRLQKIYDRVFGASVDFALCVYIITYINSRIKISNSRSMEIGLCPCETVILRKKNVCCSNQLLN